MRKPEESKYLVINNKSKIIKVYYKMNCSTQNNIAVVQMDIVSLESCKQFFFFVSLDLNT